MSKYYSEAAKQDWIERVIAVNNFHVEQCQKHKVWGLRDTAQLLQRSLGAVSQDVMVAHWLKTHENQLRRFHLFTDALAWVKDKKKEMKMYTF